MGDEVAQVDAIILAGGIGDEVAKVEGVLSKVAVNICGEPLLSRVVRALLSASAVRNIAIVTHPQLCSVIPLHDFFERLVVLEDAGSIWENTQLALRELREPTDFVLFVAGDVPFLNGKLVDEFVAAGLSSNSDIVYPIVPKEAYESAFLGCKRTFVRLRGGIFTGGNCMLIRWRVLDKIADIAGAAISARKKVWQLARLLGFKTLLKMPFGLLTIEELKAHAERMLGCTVFVLVTDAAELAFDIDEVGHLEYARMVCSSYRL